MEILLLTHLDRSFHPAEAIQGMPPVVTEMLDRQETLNHLDQPLNSSVRYSTIRAVACLRLDVVLALGLFARVFNHL